MKQQMEKKRKKEQERRKSFKAERMQQEMSHVSGTMLVVDAFDVL